MTIPDAARAASRAAVTDQLRDLGIPNADRFGDVLADAALNAIPIAGYMICPPGVEKFPREYGICHVCGGRYTLTLVGWLRVHGSRTNPCRGSGRRPAATA